VGEVQGDDGMTIDKSIPSGWKRWTRFENAFVSDTGLHIIFITPEGKDKFNFKLLGEFPEPDKNLQGFKVTKEHTFKTFEEAWKHTRKAMLKLNAENRVRKRYS
jgi:hypothetical protein